MGIVIVILWLSVLAIFKSMWTGAIIGGALIITYVTIINNSEAFTFVAHKRETNMFKEQILQARLVVVIQIVATWIVAWWLL